MYIQPTQVYTHTSSEENVNEVWQLILCVYIYNCDRAYEKGP